MVTADYPSIVSLPLTNPGVATVLDYLIIKFPAIAARTWRQRVIDGKVHYDDGSLVTEQSPFKAQQRILYYKEVDNEPLIPFKEDIIFQDEHILIAYKPHFLAVIPGGIYVNECLQNRLRRSTGIKSLQALHRLDRVTAGLVMFSTNPNTGRDYHQLFASRNIQKIYQAVALIKHIDTPEDDASDNLEGKQWDVENRIIRSEPRFRMRVAEDRDLNEDNKPNSHSIIRCVKQTKEKALFELTPITGKTHQLRVHMQSLGWPILNDRYYPHLQPLSEDDHSRPLQLLAKELRFIDPITNQARHFQCDRDLSL